MEAKLASDLPTEAGWQFEPKWDGFRAIAARRAGGAITLMSKSGKPLDRYFPEIIAMFAAIRTPDYAVDGEIILTRDEVKTLTIVPTQYSGLYMANPGALFAVLTLIALLVGRETKDVDINR